MDRMSEVLNQFTISADVFHSGSFCRQSIYDASDIQGGQLHFLESGRLQMIDHQGNRLVLNEPSMLFSPRPTSYRLIAAESDKAKVVSASICFGTGFDNPLVNALPSRIVVKLKDCKTFTASTKLLFEEANHQRPGRVAMMNHLTEIFLITLLRHTLETDLRNQGMLVGLVHPQLDRVIKALHAHPENQWSLEKMAALATMSRSKFSATFKSVLGQSPGDYLMAWRVCVAQKLLRKGKPVNWVANEVGYRNASALARVFRKIIGCSPKEWLIQQEAYDEY